MRWPSLFALSIALLAAHASTAAARPRSDKPAPAAPAPPPPHPPQPSDTRAYDPQLMRLAELLGALTTMRQLCGDADADAWRQRMQALLDAEGSPPSRKDRLAGAYNHGLQGYALTYHGCTANAQLVIRRFLEESSRLARDIANRYRAS